MTERNSQRNAQGSPGGTTAGVRLQHASQSRRVVGLKVAVLLVDKARVLASGRIGTKFTLAWLYHTKTLRRACRQEPRSLLHHSKHRRSNRAPNHKMHITVTRLASGCSQINYRLLMVQVVEHARRRSSVNARALLSLVSLVALRSVEAFQDMVSIARPKRGTRGLGQGLRVHLPFKQYWRPAGTRQASKLEQSSVQIKFNQREQKPAPISVALVAPIRPNHHW